MVSLVLVVGIDALQPLDHRFELRQVHHGHVVLKPVGRSAGLPEHLIEALPVARVEAPR